MQQVYELFQKKIEAEIRDIEFSLGRGNCAGFEEYKTSAGTILGLEKALALYEETLKSVNEEDNDD